MPENTIPSEYTIDITGDACVGYEVAFPYSGGINRLNEGKPPQYLKKIKTQRKNKYMKITITNTSNELDPTGRFTEAEYERILNALEAEQAREISRVCPDSVVAFRREKDARDGGYIKIETDDYLEELQAHRHVQHALEEIHERGNFWDVL